MKFTRFFFVELSFDRKLLLRELSINRNNNIYEVHLINTSTDEFISTWNLRVRYSRLRFYAYPYLTHIAQIISFGYYCGYIPVEKDYVLSNPLLEDIVETYKEWSMNGKIYNERCPVLL